MKRYLVEFTEAASDDLSKILRYVSMYSSPDRAYHFCERIRQDCASLAVAPNRGTVLSNGIRRIEVARGRASVMFRVEEKRVVIFAVSYYGRRH